MIEMNRSNIRIDPTLEIDEYWNPISIKTMIEMYFDVDEKFGLNINEDADAWLYMYANYNPTLNYLHIEYYIDRRSTDEYYTYTPTASEREVIISMIEETCREIEGCSCEELLSR